MRYLASQGRECPEGTAGRVALILAILALEAVVGSGRASLGGLRFSLQTLLFGGAALAVVGLTLKRLEYGLLLLPLIAVAVPYSIGTGTASSVVAALAFAVFLIVAWVVRMLLTRQLILMTPSLSLPLLGFTITVVLATVYSNVSRDPLVWVPQSWTTIQSGGLAVFIVSAGLFQVAMSEVRHIRWIENLVWMFLALGAVTFVAFMVRSGSDPAQVSIGGLFSMWVVALALGQALFNHRIPPWGRIALTILAMAWLWRRFFLETNWISGWLPAIVAIWIICLLKSRWAFVAAIAGSVAVWMANYDAIYASQVVGGDSGGNFLRLDLWQQNLEVTRNHLLLGTGVAGYAPYYASYFPDRALSTHSNYLDIFAETGLVGSFFFLWFLVALLRAGVESYRVSLPSPFGRGFTAGALGALFGLLVAMALGDWLIPFVYNQTIAGFRYTLYSWLFLGAAAAVRHIDLKG